MTLAVQLFILFGSLTAISLFSYIAGYSAGYLDGRGVKFETRKEKIHSILGTILWLLTLACGIAIIVQLLIP